MSSPVLRLVVRLTPRGGRDAVEGWARDGHGSLCLKVRVAAPPVEGAANAALLRLLSGALGLRRASVRIVAGDHGRLKRLEIEGADLAELYRVFGRPD